MIPVSRWSLACLALLCVGPAGSAAKAAPATLKATISGSATYHERIVLPRGSVFEATLEEATRNDIPGELIGHVRRKRPGHVPIAFQIPYDTKRIDSRMSYLVRATVRDRRGRMLFTGTKKYPAEALRHLRRVEVPMRRG